MLGGKRVREAGDYFNRDTILSAGKYKRTNFFIIRFGESYYNLIYFFIANIVFKKLYMPKNRYVAYIYTASFIRIIQETDNIIPERWIIVYGVQYPGSLVACTNNYGPLWKNIIYCFGSTAGSVYISVDHP
ncbi:MAG: hypothetical protein WCT06_06680 [Armatimonadota bacterium]